MSSLALRPRFKKQLVLQPKQVEKKFIDYLNRPDAKCIGNVVSKHIVLKVPKNIVHYWSPELAMDLFENDKGTEIRGLFGPAPNVWTMFIFFYMLVGFLGLIFTMYGFTQYSLGKAPVALWAFPITIAVELTIYFIAQSGKKIAHEQITYLNNILNEIIT